MSWFELDSESIAARMKAGPSRPAPTLVSHALRGILGFTLVSVAGFAPWVLGGKWFHQNVGEVGMYIACAVVFVGLSGPLLHKLIFGGGLLTFYKLFGIAFTLYAIAWIAGWMTLRGHVGGVAGLFAGTALMGIIFALAFDALNVVICVILVLFVTNAAGYFGGGVVEGLCPEEHYCGHAALGRVLWDWFRLRTWHGFFLLSGKGAESATHSEYHRLALSRSQQQPEPGVQQFVVVFLCVGFGRPGLKHSRLTNSGRMPF